MPDPFVGPLPRIWGTQIGLGNPAQIDQIKEDMLNGRYAFDEPRGMITGVIGPRGVYYVVTGDYRMAAAAEIFRESGNDLFIRLLLGCGDFPKVTIVPPDGRPMPGRDWWSWIRNLIRYWY